MSIILWAATLQKQAEDRPNRAPKENNSEADMFPNYFIQGCKYIVHLESRRKWDRFKMYRENAFNYNASKFLPLVDHCTLKMKLHNYF
jgi:hypothetical protein